MKKIRILLLFTIFLPVVLSATGCVGDSSDDIKFDTLDEMKTEIGDGLLYPDALPFEPTDSTFYGYHYTRSKTWDYVIWFDSDFTVYNYEAYRQLEEGSPIVAYIGIETHEPKHRDSVIRTPRQNAMNAYNRLIEESRDAAWEINGVTVPYKCELTAEASMYSGVNEERPAYVYVDGSAAFMRDGILYAVEIRVNGHTNEAEEKMREVSENMLNIVLVGMIKEDK